MTQRPGTNFAISDQHGNPLLSHREIRQALAFANDRDALVRYLLHGQARVASGILPPNHWRTSQMLRSTLPTCRSEQNLERQAIVAGATEFVFVSRKNITPKNNSPHRRRAPETNGARLESISNFVTRIGHSSFGLRPAETSSSPSFAGAAPTTNPDVLNLSFPQNDSPDGANRDTTAIRV